MDEPKKIPASQVEVLGADGGVVKEAENNSTASVNFGGFSQLKVMKVGPWALLLLPVIIPLFVVGFFLVLLLAMLFGRGIFKMFFRKIKI